MSNRSRQKGLSNFCAPAARFANTHLVFVLLLMAAYLPSAHGQDLDETRRRFAPIQAALGWENVTQAGQYICGAQPKCSLGKQLEVVRLHPGSSIEFFVPAHELVRVVRSDGGAINPEAVEIWTSNGSGLYRKQNVAMTADQRSCLAAPDQAGISVAKVARPAHAKTCIDVVIFTSRRSAHRLLDYYQCNIPNGRLSTISDGTTRKRDYTFFPRESFRRINVTGGKRLRIEARLKYDGDTKRKQTFWVSVYVDGQLHRILSLDTQPHTSSRQFVDGCETLLGRREFSYIDLDCGKKRVELRVSHDAFIRVDGVGLDLCRQPLNRSFSLPDWKNPQKAVSIWHASSFDPSTPQLGQVFAESDISPLTNSNFHDTWDPYLNQQTILRLARNNRVPHAGLRAYMWMRAIASMHYGDVQYGDEISVPELASRIKQRYTIYKTLMPQTFGIDNEPKHVAYHRHVIRSQAGGWNCGEVNVGQQHVEDGLGSLSRTTMVRVPKGVDDGLTYQLPESLGDTVIRFVVDQTHLSEPARFLVQYDQRPPIQMAIMPRSSVHASQFGPASSQAALTALAHVHKRFDSGAVGGPYAMTHREPTAVIKAATASLFKPADVRQVHVSLIACNGKSMNVAMQYLDGSQTRLSESAFRHLRTVLANEAPASGVHEFARQELENDGVELELLLKSRLESFTDSLGNAAQVQPPKDPWGEAELQETQLRAEQLLEAGRVPEAIKLLTQIVRHDGGVYRRKAVLLRIEALLSASEKFLAKKELSGWIEYGSDDELRRAALKRLVELSADDDKTREELLAVSAIKMADPDLEQELARQFVQNGRFGLALRTLTSHVPVDGNQDVLLRCSYRLGWWKLFDETVASLTDEQERNLWTGLKQLRLGAYTKARESLLAAGDLGTPWIKHWDLGESVFRRLASRSAKTRMSALPDWEHFQASHPGPYQWQVTSGAIHKCAGSAVVHLQNRNLRLRHYVADPGRPTEIMIHGPVKLKIEARPVHPVDSMDPINDWLILESNGTKKQVPIINNRPSKTLSIDETERVVPGATIVAEIDVPAGLNRFTLQSGNSLLLFRVLAYRPELKMPFLPAINEHSLAAVIKGSFGRQQHACGYKDTNRIRIIGPANCRTCSLGYNAVECGCNELHSAQHHFNQLPFAIANPWQGRVNPNAFSLVQDEADQQLMEAFRMADMDAKVSIENEREKLLQLARVQELVGRFPDRDDIASVLTRLRRDFVWKRFKQFDRRAGVRTIPVDGWAPESPGARIRASMMLGSPGHVLSSSKPLLQINVADDQTTKFRITARRPQISFLPTFPTVVQVRSRGKSHDMTLDDPDQFVGIGARLASGGGVIEVEYTNPATNNFVQVFVDEYMSDGSLQALDREQIDAGKNSGRSYHVATKEEPLVFRVVAPAVVRIDRLDGHQTLQEFVSVMSDRAFTLSPTMEGEQHLYRIFTLTAQTEESATPQQLLAPATLTENPESPVHWSGDVVQTMYQEIENHAGSGPHGIDRLALVPQDIEPKLIELNDDIARNRFLKGTWGAEFGYRQRRALEEFPNASADDQFLELKLSRLLFEDFKNLYTQNELIVRPRFGSGVTLGVKHQGTRVFQANDCDAGCSGNWGPIQIDWQGYYYSQLAAPAVAAYASETPRVGGFRAAISRWHGLDENWSHRPKLSMFGRGLSENRNGYEPGGLDQDIFTNFKSDHRYGLILSDKLVFQNCLDRRFWFRPTLMTNENEWVPDNVGLQFGTDQLFGPLQVKLAYRFSNFFEDDDRRNSSLQNVLYADFMWEQWQNRNRLSQFNFSVRNNLDNGQTSLGINIVSFSSQARGYRDFRPGTTLFRSIRSERHAQSFAKRRGF